MPTSTLKNKLGPVFEREQDTSTPTSKVAKAFQQEDFDIDTGPSVQEITAESPKAMLAGLGRGFAFPFGERLFNSLPESYRDAADKQQFIAAAAEVMGVTLGPVSQLGGRTLAAGQSLITTGTRKALIQAFKNPGFLAETLSMSGAVAIEQKSPATGAVVGLGFGAAYGATKAVAGIIKPLVSAERTLLAKHIDDVTEIKGLLAGLNPETARAKYLRDALKRVENAAHAAQRGARASARASVGTARKSFSEQRKLAGEAFRLEQRKVLRAVGDNQVTVTDAVNTLERILSTHGAIKEGKVVENAIELLNQANLDGASLVKAHKAFSKGRVAGIGNAGVYRAPVSDVLKVKQQLGRSTNWSAAGEFRDKVNKDLYKKILNPLKDEAPEAWQLGQRYHKNLERMDNFERFFKQRSDLNDPELIAALTKDSQKTNYEHFQKEYLKVEFDDANATKQFLSEAAILSKNIDDSIAVMKLEKLLQDTDPERVVLELLKHEDLMDYSAVKAFINAHPAVKQAAKKAEVFNVAYQTFERMKSLMGAFKVSEGLALAPLSPVAGAKVGAGGFPALATKQYDKLVLGNPQIVRGLDRLRRWYKGKEHVKGLKGVIAKYFGDSSGLSNFTPKGFASLMANQAKRTKLEKAIEAIERDREEMFRSAERRDRGELQFPDPGIDKTRVTFPE